MTTTAPAMKEFVHTVEQIAAANHAHHVDVITVELGANCSVSPYYFYNMFHEASQNTILEHAQLVFIESADAADEHANDVILCGLELT